MLDSRLYHTRSDPPRPGEQRRLAAFSNSGDVADCRRQAAVLQHRCCFRNVTDARPYRQELHRTEAGPEQQLIEYSGDRRAAAAVDPRHARMTWSSMMMRDTTTRCFAVLNALRAECNRRTKTR
jgi:hypothetical protein